MTIYASRVLLRSLKTEAPKHNLCMCKVQSDLELTDTTPTMAGAANDLKILGIWASPYVLLVRLALSIKGISYEYAEEELRHKSELLLQSNPVHNKVPVLIHGGKPLCESC
ncbi:glutathione S-transferase U18-like [Triticum urartu]|nr:glutathione S-transferase U18-like [Triticum urartu]